MKRKFIIGLILGALLAGLPRAGFAQKRTTKRQGASKTKNVKAAPVVISKAKEPESPPLKIVPVSPETIAARGSLLEILPQSDAVAFVDVKRILDEALPAILASDSKRLAQVTAQLERFKQQTGLDPRQFENVAVGLRITPNAGGFDAKPLVLVRGAFKAGALIAAGRFVAKARQEEYKSKQIFLFDIGDALKDIPLLDKLGTDLAVTEISENTLALGDLATVKEVLDANGDGPRVSRELVALATRNPNALLGLGVNVPTGAIAKSFTLDVESDEIGKTVNAIKQASATLTMMESGAELALAARTEKEAEAKDLTDTLNALKQFAGIAVGSLKTPAQQKLAANALETLKVAQNGNEMQVSLEIKRSDFPALLKLFN